MAESAPEAPAGSLDDAWREALSIFERDLTATGAAEATRRAYATDLDQFARWAESRRLEPDAVGHRDLRRFAAELSSGGAQAATVARKLAATRSFFNSLMRAGRVDANPADLVASPKRGSKLPRVLTREEMEALLDRIPARTPLELRDRAMLELAYSCGLRAQEVVGLDLDSPDFEGERLRVEGKGGKTRFVPIGEPAQRALRRLPRARPARARRAGGLEAESRAARLQERAPAASLRPAPAAGAVGAPRRDRRRRLAARAAPLVRHPPAGGRSRPAGDPGAAGTLQRLDHTGLHPSGAFMDANSVRSQSSASVICRQRMGHARRDWWRLT